MPTLTDVLAFLSAVPTTTALIILALAASVMVAVRDWRLSIFALALHYVLASLFLTRIIRSDIAMIKMLVGATICVTLYITARRASEGTVVAPASTEALPGRWLTGRLRFESGWPFRALVALLGLVVATSAATRLGLPSTLPEIVLACYILFIQGLLALGLTDEPLKGGLGVLTVIIGFDLFYSGVEQSLIVVGLLGLVNFSIALAVAYLTTLQAGVPTTQVSQ
ncbi:MAG: hypothetical protein JW850_00780 [Thermoflexales bacterium]|nr:hypothetical protein [Thermoflexales bacterium]